MEKRWSSLKKIACFLAIMLLIVITLYPLVISDFVLPEWGGGMVHSDPHMSENIRLPVPTENVGELWYSHDYGGELIGCFGNGIAGNGNISATTFNLPFFHKNLMIYDYYGNRLWTDESILNFMACSSTPMVDKYNRVVACDNETIIMVNASDLNNIEVEWETSISLAPLGENFPTTPLSPTIMENETIILPSSNGPVFVFDVNTGELLEEIYPGVNETINPFWGLPRMNQDDYITMMMNHYIHSICPYRYNSTSERIEWNSSVPYGILPTKKWIFSDGDFRFYVNKDNVIVLQRDGLDWVQLASNDIGTPQNCTGEGYYTTKNSACVENNTVYLSTEYYKEGFAPYNTTIGRLYAINVTRDFENGTVDWEEYWNYTYSGTAKASPVLIDDTIFFDGYNDTEFAEDRDPHIYAMYTNGTERWNISYPNITLFSMAADPRGGVWYEDSDAYNPYGQGGNKLVRFSEENGSIIEEIDIKTLIGDTSEEPVLPCSTMTICGTTGNYIMLMSANKPYGKGGKWVLAINLSDNNSLIWQVPIKSKFDWNYAGGEYVIGRENNVSRVIFGTFFGGVMAIGSHPDTWFKNLSYNPCDISGDGVNDSVNVSFSIRAGLPHDLATVKLALISEDYPIIQRKIISEDYEVNTSDTNDNITITLSWLLDGEYKLGVYLFNSSGKFKSEHLNISDLLKFDIGLFANESHEFGPFELHSFNTKPYPPNQPTGPTEVENWDKYSYTTNTTDNESDYLYYQWKWDTAIIPLYSTWDILNPYESGENCTYDIGWIGTGSRDISVRAKDHWLSIDPTDWSTPLTVTVSQSDNSNGCSWNNPLLDGFSANVVAVNEQTSSTGFSSEVYINDDSRGGFTWDWDFGDGNTSNEEEVSHNYSQVGNYTVNLTLSYEGDIYNVSTVIQVLPLKARYSTSSDGAQPYVDIIFNDTSQGLYNITNHTWDFDDGTISYEQNVSHSFDSEGIYNVTLTVTDQDTNVNTHYQIIHVETTTPTVIYVDESPHTVGFGSDVNIYADFFDNGSLVDSVSVNIAYPDDSFGNFSMSKNLSCPYDFEYVFTDTWQVGLYNYSIWVYDHAGNCNATGLFNFSISANATINVATLKDTYGASEIINITDPPDPPENYYLTGRGLTYNTYYNATSGCDVLEAYVGPVNYQDENEDWIPINQTVEILESNHSAYSYGYRAGNNKGLYGTYFKPNVQDDWPVAFSYSKSDNPTTHVVRSKLVGVGYLDPSSDWDYEYLQSVQSSQGQIEGSSVVYEDVFTGTDVRWTYGNSGLKEDIIMSSDAQSVLESNPPSDFGLSNNDSYLVFITRLDYQGLTMYDSSGELFGNVTIMENGVDFKDVLGEFKCALPLGEAYEIDDPMESQILTYRIVHYDGDTYLLSGLKLADLQDMTFPVVIDPTITVYSTVNDGYIYKYQNLGYNGAWTAASGTVYDTSYYMYIGQKRTPLYPFGYTYRIYRGYLFFDTSYLPSNAYISSATVSLTKGSDYSDTDFDVTIQNGQPTYPHDPLQAGDYNKSCYSGNGGSFNTSSFSSGSNDITVTNHNWITKEGMTKLCLRSSRDISGISPTGNEYVVVRSANYVGTSYDPKLVVEYRNQSKIKNTGSTNISGYLYMTVEYDNDSTWELDVIVVNETNPSTINIGEQLALDQFFNGNVNTDDLTYGGGTYRVYAAFRDLDGEVLMTDDEELLEDWYELTVSLLDRKE